METIWVVGLFDNFVKVVFVVTLIAFIFLYLRQYLRVIYRLFIRKQGVLYKKTSDQLAFSMTSRIDEKNFKKYKDVCQYADDDDRSVVFLCYMETLFLKLLLKLVFSSDFPLSPLGLIHIKQTITQHQDVSLLLNSDVCLEVRVLEYREVPRGVEVDLQMTVRDLGGICVWEGVLTLLSRDSATQKSGMKANEKNHSQGLDGKAAEIKVDGNTGLKYARITGDWNPHHLYPWTARMLGYRKPIAHGMWTLSRAVAQIHKSNYTFGSKWPVHIDALFKRPLFMPGKARIRYKKCGQNTSEFSVTDMYTGAPHLVGKIFI